MPVTRDIVATYRGPGKVMRRLLDLGPREDRALAFVMGACILIFVSQWPVLSRQAHLLEQDLNQLLGASLMAWVFVAPLILYLLALATHRLARAVGGQGTGYGARLALFWSLLASSPLILLNGLVGGFIGPGPALQLVGAVWFGVFMWFWIRCLMVAERRVPA
ncbi:MAG: YIP1 family protein [Paracoccaceae bacterium]|nr:YIP1 family protein [Paracoccaceae bacterium]